MNVKRTNTSETEVKLVISVGSAELESLKKSTVAKLGKKLKVAGFRPGKAPASVIEKQIDDNQLQVEVLQDAIEEYYKEAAIKELLKPLASPQVDVKKFVPFTELEFEAKLEIMPDIKLGDYSKMKKSAPKNTATDKEVMDVVENLRTRVAEKVSVDKKAENGDEVWIDFEGVDVKGTKVAGASGDNYPLNLGSNTFIPGFEDGLVGVNKGDKKDLKLAFPRDYHAANLAGTKITFKVTVKDIKQVVLPKVDDELAAKLGPFKTLDDLKRDIKAQLIEQKTSEAVAKVKDEIVEELVKKSKLALPKILLEDQMASLQDDMKQNLTYRGITLKDYIAQEKFKDEAEWKEKALKPQAERRVSVGMVLAEVAEKEKLTVSEAELNERVSLYKTQYQQQAGDFDTPEMQREVLSRMLTEKTVEFLYQQATK